MLEVVEDRAMVMEPKIEEEEVDVVVKEANIEEEKYDVVMKELEDTLQQSIEKSQSDVGSRLVEEL